MTTNLLATIIVTLVTNTTERFPTHQEPTPCEPGPYPNVTLAIYCTREVPDANPTNKWVKTTVTRIKTLQFDYDPAGGMTPIEPYSFTYKTEVISEHEVEYVLRQEWEQKDQNIYIDYNSLITFTNGQIGQVRTNLPIYTKPILPIYITNTAPDRPPKKP